MLRWLLLDYGQVLCAPPPDDEWEGLWRAAGYRDASAFRAAYWNHRPAYDRADLTAREYWELVAPGAELEPLRRLDVRIWLHPLEASLKAAERARGRGFELALLSNAPAEVAEAIDGLPWLAGVSKRFYSCRLRRVKPDPEAYLQVLAGLGAAPEDVVFFDDRPDNVAGARALGLRSYVFTDAGQLDEL